MAEAEAEVFAAGAGPASPALMQALAAHPEQMADLVGTLDGRVLDAATLLDLIGRICRAAVRLLDGGGVGRDHLSV